MTVAVTDVFPQCNIQWYFKHWKYRKYCFKFKGRTIKDGRWTMYSQIAIYLICMVFM